MVKLLGVVKSRFDSGRCIKLISIKMKNIKEIKLGDKVKVVKPSKYSQNKKGTIGYITDIKHGQLDDIGRCMMYKVDMSLIFDPCMGTWESINGIIKL